MRANYYIILAICSLILSSCEEQVTAPDVSNISLDYNIHRFEEQLYQMDTNDVYMALNKLSEEHPYFSKIYFTEILPLEDKQNFEVFYESIKSLSRDEAFKEVVSQVNEKYGDFSKQKKEFDQAFRYLKHYFPAYNTPNVYTFTSYFGFQCFIFEDGLRDGVGIGLDLFLGEDMDYKTLDPQNPMFSNYITQFFTPDFVVKRAIEQIIEDKVGAEAGNKLVDFMLHNGKKLYLMKKIMPGHDDAIIHEYTAEQMDWCKNNEGKIWSFFVDREMLYTSNITDIKRYTDLAPTSRNMPAQSPGRTANYVGMKIVESYMKKHPETTIPQLLSMKDGTSFLQSSGYKAPRK